MMNKTYIATELSWFEKAAEQFQAYWYNVLMINESPAAKMMQADLKPLVIVVTYVWLNAVSGS